MFDSWIYDPHVYLIICGFTINHSFIFFIYCWDETVRCYTCIFYVLSWRFFCCTLLLFLSLQSVLLLVYFVFPGVSLAGQSPPVAVAAMFSFGRRGEAMCSYASSHLSWYANISCRSTKYIEIALLVVIDITKLEYFRPNPPRVKKTTSSSSIVEN